jgi:transglutaminase-like putative cysteine protease
MDTIDMQSSPGLAQAHSAAATGRAARPSAADLAPGRFVDSDHPAIVAFARAHADEEDTRLRAVALYYAVRDEIRYDPYRIDLSEDGLKASRSLTLGYGFCITKAALLAAVARAAGIPARLGFADVKNHLTSARLRATMQTDVFVFHGYTEMFLDGRWVKATPAFNRSLCEKAGILPLEFDGQKDSVFHPFDASGRRHMEYVRTRGSFSDVPRAEILAAFAEVYPASAIWTQAEGDFETEARGGD